MSEQNQTRHGLGERIVPVDHSINGAVNFAKLHGWVQGIFEAQR
jgi:hypothetical protein